MNEGDVSLSVRMTDGTAWIAGGKGRSLVFVHGVGMNREVWTPQLKDLGTDHQVVAYDMMGHGESALPAPDADLDAFREQLREVVDYSGTMPVTLIGHSMGALVALDFALRYPQRVASVIALNSVHNRTTDERMAVLRRAQMLDGTGLAETIDETMERWFGPADEQKRPNRAQQVREWLINTDPMGYALAYWIFARADEHLSARVAELAVPALFVTGELDPNSTPEMSRQLAAEAPDGEVRILPGGRHMMAFEQPEVINPVLREFLARTADSDKVSDICGDMYS